MGPCPKLRHVIWDLGGTLVDTYPVTVEVFLSVLHELDKSADFGEVRALFCTSTDHALQTMAGRFGVEVAGLRSRLRAGLARLPRGTYAAFPGALEALALVRASGGLNLLVTHRRRRDVVELLTDTGLAPFIDDLVTAEDPWPRKPDPAALAGILERHHGRREDTLVVGDRRLDIEAGHRAGILTCCFGERSAVPGSDFYLDHLGALGRILAGASELVVTEATR